MAWKTIYKGKSLEEGAKAAANVLREADRQREEWLASQQKSMDHLAQSVSQQDNKEGSGNEGN